MDIVGAGAGLHGAREVVLLHSLRHTHPIVFRCLAFLGRLHAAQPCAYHLLEGFVLGVDVACKGEEEVGRVGKACAIDVERFI